MIYLNVIYSVNLCNYFASFIWNFHGTAIREERYIHTHLILVSNNELSNIKYLFIIPLPFVFLSF